MKKEREQFLDLIVYQIYPRSFYDSNGDGIGDLNGITAKLDHFVELGINAIWICPCYKSPNYDNGYDVSDYRDIMTEFGTLDDWKNLREQTKKRNIKLIMDLVFNHTSSEHIWFREGRKSRDNPYHDYYIWRDTPPNDWQSVFGGSAWEYNADTKEYYLHSFAVQQPDLNWENPIVRQQCCDVVDFWVDLGVDGFRCDVLDFISKDFSKNKMYGGPRLHEFIRQLFGREKVAHIFTIGECQTSEKDTCDICGENRNELTTVFQFDHIHLARQNKYHPTPFHWEDLRNILVRWQYFSARNDLLYTLFTDNHDNAYFLSRTKHGQKLRYERATMLATMFYLLKGIPFLYQTQEYGAINPYYDTVDHFSEVETIQYYREQVKTRAEKEVLEEINVGSRDNTRRPFAWNANAEDGFGFSFGNPWLPYHSLAENINLEQDKNSEKSVFAFYKKLLALRKGHECARYGEFVDCTQGQNDCFLYKRIYKGKTLLVLCNFEKEKTLRFPAISSQTHTRVLSNYADGQPFSAVFRPFEIAVYLSK